MGRLKALPPRIKESKVSRITPATSGSWRAEKAKTSERGYGWRWQKARLRFLQENPLCVYCQRQGRVTAATVVDHITPHRGDMDLFWDSDNWQPLCKHCHDSTKKREEAQGVG